MTELFFQDDDNSEPCIKYNIISIKNSLVSISNIHRLEYKGKVYERYWDFSCLKHGDWYLVN